MPASLPPGPPTRALVHKGRPPTGNSRGALRLSKPTTTRLLNSEKSCDGASSFAVSQLLCEVAHLLGFPLKLKETTQGKVPVQAAPLLGQAAGCMVPSHGTFSYSPLVGEQAVPATHSAFHQCPPKPAAAPSHDDHQNTPHFQYAPHCTVQYSSHWPRVATINMTGFI